MPAFFSDGAFSYFHVSLAKTKLEKLCHKLKKPDQICKQLQIIRVFDYAGQSPSMVETTEKRLSVLSGSPVISIESRI